MPYFPPAGLVQTPNAASPHRTPQLGSAPRSGVTWDEPSSPEANGCKQQLQEPLVRVTMKWRRTTRRHSRTRSDTKGLLYEVQCVQRVRRATDVQQTCNTARPPGPSLLLERFRPQAAALLTFRETKELILQKRIPAPEGIWVSQLGGGQGDSVESLLQVCVARQPGGPVPWNSQQGTSAPLPCPLPCTMTKMSINTPNGKSRFCLYLLPGGAHVQSITKPNQNISAH